MATAPLDTPMELKGGFETLDPRLDRIPQFDERSRNYPVTALIEDGEELTNKWWKLDAHLNQGAEGACVGFAMAHELIADPVPVHRRFDVEIDNAFARNEIYLPAQRIDEWEGGAYPGADPFYEGTSVLAGFQVLEQMGFIEEYRWAFGADDAIRAIVHVGPVVLGIPWFEGMYEPDENRYIWPVGRKVGGHAIIAIAYDANLDEVWLHNSWGRDYGLDGRARVKRHVFEELLGNDGEAGIPVIRKDPGATPVSLGPEKSRTRSRDSRSKSSRKESSSRT